MSGQVSARAMSVTMKSWEELDLVKYEIFRHRLFNILEEGRIAIRFVSGSPVVVEGGECMCAFFTADGTPILIAAGVTLHSIGARDFIKKAIEWYEDDPGIYDGDQFFFNDPYIGGCHLPDMVIIKPIFYQGKRIAWTGSIMHTADTGGLQPSGEMPMATEVFQEGIRILGLKIVEKGKFRPDVFRSIVQQVRDPHLVGLDTKAKIAANNVCARAYLGLIEKFGTDFVAVASQKIIDDAGAMTKAKLRKLPDGIWRSRIYSSAYKDGKDQPYRICCTITKEGEQVTFDLSGSSPQMQTSMNIAYPGSWCALFAALTIELLWEVPWNGGMLAALKLVAPEGTVVNCRFPAACSWSMMPVIALSGAVLECTAKMLYAGSIYEDVTASIRGGGFGSMLGQYGGHNQHGGPVGGIILDAFAHGMGAKPDADGQNSGGVEQNPQSTISDVEIIEMNYPFLCLGRNHETDSGGYGRYAGGLGLYRLFMVHGSNDFTVSHGRYGAAPCGWGMFGGYPASVQSSAILFESELPNWLKESRYPVDFEELKTVKGDYQQFNYSFMGRPVKPHGIISDELGGGGGYGDPLNRNSEAVVEDIRRGAVSVYNAEKLYGMVVDSTTLELSQAETVSRRRAMLEERLREGKKPIIGKPLEGAVSH